MTYTPGPKHREPPPPIHERWLEWDRRNPGFYLAFRRYAFELIGAGRAKLSAKAIFERIRWDEYLKTAGEQWKANNNYTAYYARMFMLQDDAPDLFETRIIGDDRELVDDVIRGRIAERRRMM